MQKTLRLWAAGLLNADEVQVALHQEDWNFKNNLLKREAINQAFTFSGNTATLFLMPIDAASSPLKILTLDGGGSKGIYTLGILQEMQTKLKIPLADYFDCFYGTSTGAVIASMLVLGRSIPEIKEVYLHQIPHVMKKKGPACRTAELKLLLKREFGDTKFEECRKYLGIITSFINERKPKIFRPRLEGQAGNDNSLFSGYGFTIAEALLSSCAAVPYFEQVKIRSSDGSRDLFLIDGGFLANNPTVCSILDAQNVFGRTEEELFVINVGSGSFPRDLKARHVFSVVNRSLLSRYMMDYVKLGLRKFFLPPERVAPNPRVLRVNAAFSQKFLKTNFLEDDIGKLKTLYDMGRRSFSDFEHEFETRRPCPPQTSIVRGV